MNWKPRSLSKNETGLLIAFSGLILGGWIRIYTVLNADFPINDGGLFYKMVQVLQAGKYALPSYFSYNGLKIPFAYPPIGFYLAAAISDIFNISLLDIFRFLPATVLIFTIPAFYGLAKTLLPDTVQAGIAALVFSLTPRSVTWFIMGGGITRSVGFLFLILAVRYVYLAFSNPSRKFTSLSILFCSLTVLTHPEAALHTASIGLLIFLFKGRNRLGVITASLISTGTLVFTSIWWLPLISRFSLAPILSAGLTGLNGTQNYIYPLVAFSGETSITFIMVLGFLGLFFETASSNFFLPALYILPFIVEVRYAANVAILPLALLASTALFKLIIPVFSADQTNTVSSSDQRRYRSGVILGAGVFLVIYALLTMLFHTTDLSNQRVSRANQTAFNWVRKNTPVTSRFILITGNSDLFRDWTQEWFPTYTDRISQTTIQGREWLRGSDFESILANFQNIQACINSETALSCVNERAARANIEYDYVYLARVTANNRLKNEPQGAGLLAELKNSQDYKLDYESDEVAIFERLLSPCNINNSAIITIHIRYSVSKNKL